MTEGERDCNKAKNSSAKSIPQHVAIIMDGNGRWAKAKNLPRLEGHIAGIEAVKNAIKSCLDSSVPILSLFAFSSENWQRPEDEVAGLMQLFFNTLQDAASDLNEDKVCLKFIGDFSPLFSELQKKISEVESLTQQHQRLIVNIFINYGGKWDILQATKQIIEKVQNEKISLSDVDEKLFSSCLKTAALPDPDLLIRTGGEQRISNFLLWQLAYTELYFTPVYWPDFSATNFSEAIKTFQKRHRRFGSVL